MKVYVPLVALVLSLSAARSQGAAIYTTDFIADHTRTGFNSFESVPTDRIVTPDPLVWAEGGISVEQVGHGNTSLIRLTFFHPDGDFGWDPENGSTGYTRITRTDGHDFVDVGFFYATEYLRGAVTTYALYKDGALVQTDSLTDTPYGLNGFLYLGFGGGGFDEIRMWDREKPEYAPLEYSAFMVDAIEMRGDALVPEPASLTLLGLASAAGLLRRRRQRAGHGGA